MVLQDAVETKWCSYGKHTLPVTEFYPSKRDGYTAMCKVHHLAVKRAAYVRHPKIVHETVPNPRRRKLAESTLWVQTIKEASPCTDCGLSYPYYVMDFDHLPGAIKRFRVAEASLQGFSMARVKAEIAKCELVCANCHRLRTRERGNTPLELVA